MWFLRGKLFAVRNDGKTIGRVRIRKFKGARDTRRLGSRTLFSSPTETINMSLGSSLPPSTRTLDHIVHLTPPGTFRETAEQFRQLGFKFSSILRHHIDPLISSIRVISGGTHADGLTANSLIVRSSSLTPGLRNRLPLPLHISR